MQFKKDRKHTSVYNHYVAYVIHTGQKTYKCLQSLSWLCNSHKTENIHVYTNNQLVSYRCAHRTEPVNIRGYNVPFLPYFECFELLKIFRKYSWGHHHGLELFKFNVRSLFQYKRSVYFSVNIQSCRPPLNTTYH